jgi:4-diphosphocytidyl-2-C-methyl-D-erythritol kinase
MIVFPNAKINLGLNIIARREDGFHDLESVFYPVGWADVLEVLPHSALSFQSSGIAIPGEPTENICLKAFHLLQKDHNIPPVQVYLHKIIPIGAGLGGGSSDGAFMLKALNALFELQLTTLQLQNYARQLGSDCAFFIENQPAFCFGKGDETADINLSLKGKFVVLVYPDLHISTAEAYRQIQPKIPETGIKKLLQKNIATWKTALQNDFETSLFPVYAVLAEIKTQLYAAGALYAAMSGSGSTVFGIFKEEKDLTSLFPAHFRLWQGFLD